MVNKTVNGVSVDAIVKHSEFNPENAERIPGASPVKPPQLTIVDSDPQWPEYFQLFRSRILAAFESPPNGGVIKAGSGSEITILAINHVGSTSVPGLPAKANVDVDLVLSSNTMSDEPFYVPRLEAAGFEFRLREPNWHGHRYFRAYEPMACSLHVWGPRCPEVERHLIFRDWLRTHKDDRDLYAKTKRECAAISIEKGEAMDEYNSRKEWVVRDILLKAFKDLRYLDQDGE